MPNWCRGTLRVRGKVEDLRRFVLEGLTPVDYFGNLREKLQFNNYDECECEGRCHIENTHRGFVNNLRVDLAYDEKDITVIPLDCEFAWDISATELQQTCIKYNVDMRIYAFERGMQFNRDIEIIDGQVIKDNDITFDDYDWDCICPNVGG